MEAATRKRKNRGYDAVSIILIYYESDIHLKFQTLLYASLLGLRGFHNLGFNS
jgi:hypothetical protein